VVRGAGKAVVFLGTLLPCSMIQAVSTDDPRPDLAPIDTALTTVTVAQPPIT